MHDIDRIRLETSSETGLFETGPFEAEQFEFGEAEAPVYSEFGEFGEAETFGETGEVFGAAGHDVAGEMGLGLAVILE